MSWSAVEELYYKRKNIWPDHIKKGLSFEIMKPCRRNKFSQFVSGRVVEKPNSPCSYLQKKLSVNQNVHHSQPLIRKL